MAGEIQKPTQDHLLELGILGDSGAPNPQESTKRKDIESFDLFGESQSSFTPQLLGFLDFPTKKLECLRPAMTSMSVIMLAIWADLVMNF